MLKHAFALAGALALLGCGQPQQDLDDLVTGVHYVGVAVPDVEAAATYYESAFDVERLGADEMDLQGLPAELAPALERALASGRPACVNVMTDGSVIAPITVSMVGGGSPPAEDAGGDSKVQLPYYEDLES